MKSKSPQNQKAKTATGKRLSPAEAWAKAKNDLRLSGESTPSNFFSFGSMGGSEESGENNSWGGVIAREGGLGLLLQGIVSNESLYGEPVISATALQMGLDQLEGDIEIIINSPGGIVYEGNALRDMIAAYSKGKITTIAAGECMSAATLPFLAGDKRLAGEGTMLMIHNARTGVVGNSAEMMKTVKHLQKIDAEIAKYYSKKSALSNQAIIEAMLAETFYTAEEAVEAGFASAVQDISDFSEEGESEDDKADMAAVARTSSAMRSISLMHQLS